MHTKLFLLFILAGLCGCQVLAGGEAPGTAAGLAEPKALFTLAFIPIDWQSGGEAFEAEARRQAEYFVHESGMEAYFEVSIVVLEEGPQNISLGSDGLVREFVRAAQGRVAADRYIGLTDGDLVDENISDMAGWTDGPGSLGVVVEAGNEKLLAHELGHTFGLCDEYNYSDWSQQDRSYPGGCPNPYPRDCPRLITEEIICIGQRTEDGRFSLMGPAGLDGDYGYNVKSLKHLGRVFKGYRSEKRR